MVSFPQNSEIRGPAEIPVRGKEFIPRRIYTRASDYLKHGFTQGCKGCTWAQNQLGPRYPHSEQCRRRMEAAIEQDENNDRTKKAKERLEHYLAQRVEEGDDRVERADDPREKNEVSPEQVQAPATPEGERVEDDNMNRPEEFNIGSPMQKRRAAWRRIGRWSWEHQREESSNTDSKLRHEEKKCRTSS